METQQISEEVKKDWRQEALEYFATPKSLRTETQVAFCAKRGIPESTFYYFTHTPEFKKKLLYVCIDNAKDKAPEVLRKLGEMAAEGDTTAMTLYLKFILELAEKTKAEINIGEEDRKSIRQIVDELKRNNESPVSELLPGRPESTV